VNDELLIVKLTWPCVNPETLSVIINALSDAEDIDTKLESTTVTSISFPTETNDNPWVLLNNNGPIMELRKATREEFPVKNE
jgi:hypothetical protein